MELLLPQDRHRKSFRGNEFVDQKILATIMYHDIFAYPLTQSELIKWEMGDIKLKDQAANLKFKNGFYFLEGKDGLMFKRIMSERVSQKKIKLANHAAKILSKIPTIKLVALTGSLAMQNANENSDIDLMIVTSKNTLWLSRLTAYFLLKLTNSELRVPKDNNEKDKLCLNMWLDETDLFIEKHNVYTAHEIAQIVPLVNKYKTYENLMESNSWIKKYWPNAVKIQKVQVKELKKINGLLSFLENIAFKFQYNFMKKKITREVVTPTRAFFHPYDWGEFISSQGF